MNSKKGKNYMEVVLSVSNCSERQIAKNNSPFVKFTGVDELGNEIDVCVFDDEAIDKLKLVGDKKASRVKIFNPYVNPKECIITVNQRDILKIKPISFEETSQYDHPQIHSQESNQIVQSQPEFPSVYEYYEQGQRVFHSQPSQEKHNHAKNKSISLPSDDDEVALEEPSQEKHNHTKNKPIFLSSDDDEVALEEENPIVNQHNEPLQCRLVVSENTSCLDSSQVNQKMEASEDKEFQRIVQEFEQFVQSLDYHYGCDDTQQNTDQRNNIMRTRVSHDQLPPRNEDVNCSNESQGILIVPERSAKQSVIKSFDYQRIFMEIVSKKFPERDSSLLTSSILNERRCPTLKTLKRMTKKDGIQRTAGFQRKSRKRPVDPEAPQAEVHFEQTTRRRRQAGQPLSEATTDVHSEQTTRRRRQAGQTDSHYQKLPWRYTRNKLLDVEDKPASHYRKLQRMYTRNKLLGVEDKTDSHYQKLPWRYTRNKLLDVEDKPASHYRKLQRMYTRNKLLGVEDKTDSHYRTKGILRQSKSNPQPRHPITTILKMGQKIVM
eukprot:TRINITY_DN1915_c0_g2_i13.p1 TRINITY_DN1915_c0_g2~~TRINITY_DN1915_c0_g2_i13.p1  ORF type:complete len:548 (+),score=75.98 TRINITY_DN1915_c0_g2_i13:218-1861(+)